MKLKFNFKNKEASIEAEAEKIIEKNMEYKQENIKQFGPKKTKYQIQQEEFRKNKDQEHKQNMQLLIIGCIIIGIGIAICITMSFVTGEY